MAHNIAETIWRYGLPGVGGIPAGVAVYEGARAFNASLVSVDRALSQPHIDGACYAGLTLAVTGIVYMALSKRAERRLQDSQKSIGVDDANPSPET